MSYGAGGGGVCLVSGGGELEVMGVVILGGGECGEGALLWGMGGVNEGVLGGG